MQALACLVLWAGGYLAFFGALTALGAFDNPRETFSDCLKGSAGLYLILSAICAVMAGISLAVQWAWSTINA